MRTRDRIGLYCFLAFSIFMCEESWRLGLGGFHSPGAGLFPFGISAVLGGLVIIQLVRGRKQRLESTEPFFKKERLLKFCTVLATMFGYGFMLYHLGYFLCTVLLIGICVRAMESKKWWIVAAFSFGTAIVALLVFNYWLRILTPEGAWIYPIYRK